MPAFIVNGPDIPDRLLEAHEDGRVVFFCGAGISYPAKLPDFKGLVSRLYTELVVTPNAVQMAAISNKQYDTAIGLLELHVLGGRSRVRKELAKILTPDLQAEGALTTHEALLTLARCTDGPLRLVTTNFDRLFEEVISRKNLPIKTFKAPLLPVPKQRWDGLVYLHGLLDLEPTDLMLDQLVVSSGDFGLAYLTERWAARFVSEMFRNYKICFVGYSINDPVLRYMMDALAADRLLGESTIEMFAFGDYDPTKVGSLENCEAEWKAKNVTPILYSNETGHSILHKTLHEWSTTFRDGIYGKQMLVRQHAGTSPVVPSRFDFAVGRVLWALSYQHGAKYFAEMDPVPPLKWIEPLSQIQYDYHDLKRFGVISNPVEERDMKLSYSFVQRPTPYYLAPQMSLVSLGPRQIQLDAVMINIARWLSRHLNNPKLLIWVAQHGGQMHEQFAAIIQERLTSIETLERDNDADALHKLIENARDAVPRTSMRILWRLYLDNRVKRRAIHLDMYSWVKKYKLVGLNAALKIELRQLLTPCVLLREPLDWRQAEDSADISTIVQWEIVLTADNVSDAMKGLFTMDEWKLLLQEFLSNAVVLLRDAMDLAQMLGGANEFRDLSYLQQPSIADHQQNRSFHDWTVLIEIARDAWCEAAKYDPVAANATATLWFKSPYPLFKRLAFFAAAQSGTPVPSSEAVSWLLSGDRSWWLWAVDAQHEAIRLLVSLGGRLTDDDRRRVEDAILRGPPRTMYRSDISNEDFERTVNRMTWLLLAKFKSGGVVLGPEAQQRFDKLSVEFPGWILAEDLSDEFPYWMSDGSDLRRNTPTPPGLDDLVIWLEQNPVPDFWEVDDWQDRCRTDFSQAFEALSVVGERNTWPIERWGQALQVWGEGELLAKSWSNVPTALLSMPVSEFAKLAHAVGYWLMQQSKVFERNEGSFFNIAQKLIEATGVSDSSANGMVTDALNHPIGFATQALLNWLYRQHPPDGSGLDGKVKTIFTTLSNVHEHRFRHARVFFTAHVIALFRVDQDWTLRYVIPLFNWGQEPDTAKSAWAGFLWSPRLFLPLIAVIKPALLETASHYSELDSDDGRQYAQFLTYIALDTGDLFTDDDVATATRALPPHGLEQALFAVFNALKGAGEKRVEYWRHRVLHYISRIWPQSKDVVTDTISLRMGQIALAAGDAFPEALKSLRFWLKPSENVFTLIDNLHNEGFSSKYPSAALDFLNIITSDEVMWLPSMFRDCLDAIVNADVTLKIDHRYIRLDNLAAMRS